MRTLDMGYYILDGHTPVHVDNTLEWATWFEQHHAERIVKQEQIDSYWVSTVFLGLDHGTSRIFGPGHGQPILFETMVFVMVGRKRTEVVMQERCCTWDEALEQHERVAAQFRKKLYV